MQSRLGRGRAIRPEIVEIEPVVRRFAAARLEPISIVLAGALQRSLALRARNVDTLGEGLEADAIPPVVVTKRGKENYRRTQCCGEHERAFGKRCRLPEKATAPHPVATDDSIAEDAHHLAALGRLTHLEHCFGPTERNDLTR